MNNDVKGNPKLLTPKMVEEVYSLNAGTLSNMRHFGTGPQYIKAGRRILYRVEDIEAWLERHVVLTKNDKD